MSTEAMQLYDAEGRRKYLNAVERDRFLAAAEQAARETRTFCLVLAYTGCRISDALKGRVAKACPRDIGGR